MAQTYRGIVHGLPIGALLGKELGPQAMERSMKTPIAIWIIATSSSDRPFGSRGVTNGV